jgi:hypothetical protein
MSGTGQTGKARLPRKEMHALDLAGKRVLIREDLNVPVKKFKTVVLIDRNHKKYPVKADFKGLSLSTSLKEHVQVVFEDNNDHAYLV